MLDGEPHAEARVEPHTGAEMGADIALHDLSWDAPSKYGEAEDLTAVRREIEALGVRTTVVTGNIGDSAAVAKMKTDIESMLGEVQILVNCAGGDIGAASAWDADAAGKPRPAPMARPAVRAISN